MKLANIEIMSDYAPIRDVQYYERTDLLHLSVSKKGSHAIIWTHVKIQILLHLTSSLDEGVKHGENTLSNTCFLVTMQSFKYIVSPNPWNNYLINTIICSQTGKYQLERYISRVQSHGTRCYLTKNKMG